MALHFYGSCLCFYPPYNYPPSHPIYKHFEVKEQDRQIVLRQADAVDSLTIWGHNNQVLVEVGTVLPLVIINGFDNILTPITDSVNGQNTNQQNLDYQKMLPQLRIKRLIVQGHNNRLKGLVANEITVNGHNNQFSETVYCGTLADHGRNTTVELSDSSCLSRPDQRGFMSITNRQNDWG